MVCHPCLLVLYLFVLGEKHICWTDTHRRSEWLGFVSQARMMSNTTHLGAPLLNLTSSAGLAHLASCKSEPWHQSSLCTPLNESQVVTREGFRSDAPWAPIIMYRVLFQIVLCFAPLVFSWVWPTGANSGDERTRGEKVQGVHSPYSLPAWLKAVRGCVLLPQLLLGGLSQIRTVLSGFCWSLPPLTLQAQGGGYPLMLLALKCYSSPPWVPLPCPHRYNPFVMSPSIPIWVCCLPPGCWLKRMSSIVRHSPLQRY